MARPYDAYARTGWNGAAADITGEMAWQTTTYHRLMTLSETEGSADSGIRSPLPMSN